MVAVSVGNTGGGWASRAMGAVFGRPAARHRHLDALDGLRGLALLIVLASHLGNMGFLETPDLRGTGKSGVYLFFVLSAFVLTDALLARDRSRLADRWLWIDFAWRRVLRIWPLYLVILLLSWGLTRLGVERWHYQLDTQAVLQHLSLRDGDSVLWSIPVEFKFYVLLPFVAVLLTTMRGRRWPPPLELGLLAAAVFGSTVLWPSADATENSIELRYYLPLFIAGCAAAYLNARHGPWLSAWPNAWGIAGIAGIVAWMLTTPVVWAALTGTPLHTAVNHRWFTFFAGCWTVVLLAVLYGPRWFRRPFEFRGVRLVGIVSFSAYLWHMPVLDLLRDLGVAAWPLGWLVAATATFAVSIASFLLIELPGRDLHLGRQGNGDAAPAAR